MIGVVVLLGGIAAITGGGDDDATDDTESAVTGSSETSRGAASKAVGIDAAAPALVGQVVSVGDWAIRVVSIAPDAADQIAAESRYNDPPAAGQQFFMVGLEATYIGNKSSTFWIDVGLTAVGASSVAYEGEDADCGAVPDDLDFAGEVFPGGTITGNACWAIDANDVATLMLVAEPRFSFGDDDRRFLSLDATAEVVDESTKVGAPTPQAIEGVPIGTPVEVGDWIITVKSVNPDASKEIAEQSSFNNPPADDRQFFMATLEATYKGSASSTFWIDVSLRSVGALAVTYGEFHDGCGVIPDGIVEAGETFPDGTITANVCWSIRTEDANSLTMLANSSFSFDSDRQAFSLTD